MNLAQPPVRPAAAQTHVRHSDETPKGGGCRPSGRDIGQPRYTYLPAKFYRSCDPVVFLFRTFSEDYEMCHGSACVDVGNLVHCSDPHVFVWAKLYNFLLYSRLRPFDRRAAHLRAVLACSARLAHPPRVAPLASPIGRPVVLVARSRRRSGLRTRCSRRPRKQVQLRS